MLDDEVSSLAPETKVEGELWGTCDIFLTSGFMEAIHLIIYMAEHRKWITEEQTRLVSEATYSPGWLDGCEIPAR